MATNRKQPFGYQMEFGEIVPCQPEAETVLWVYQTYLKGASYNALVDTLQERGISYHGDKPWNKNMVARILEDRRYTGVDGYPSFITEEQFNAVQLRRQDKTNPVQKPPAKKELRRLCGGAPPACVERQVLSILNYLIRYPNIIACRTEKADDAQEVKKLRRELEELLRNPPVDEEQAKALAFQIAALRLNAVGPEEYETLRLRRLFKNRQMITELDQELLRESVRKITYTGRTVTVLLKNNQSVKGGSDL